MFQENPQLGLQEKSSLISLERLKEKIKMSVGIFVWHFKG